MDTHEYQKLLESIRFIYGYDFTDYAASSVQRRISLFMQNRKICCFEITEVNPTLENSPEAVNADPYGAWLFRMKLGDAAELAALLDVAAYEQVAGD